MHEVLARRTLDTELSLSVVLVADQASHLTVTRPTERVVLVPGSVHSGGRLVTLHTLHTPEQRGHLTLLASGLLARFHVAGEV